jgi:tetratricopeptide (TPR) repeat protein
LEIPASEKQNDKKIIPVMDNKNRPKEHITEKNSTDVNIISRSEILYNEAVSLIKDSKTDEAKDIYEKILLQDPGHINSLNDMGVLFLHEGRYEDAIRYLEKAVKLKPKFANPFYNLACAYSLQNEGEKGMAYLLKAIEIDKNVKDWAKQDPDLQNLREYAELSLITK